jgi:hypothetical protein
VIVRILTHLGLPARAPPRSPARSLPVSSKQPDTQGRLQRVDAAINKPDREGNFHKTSRKLIADRISVWWYSQCLEKKVV